MVNDIQILDFFIFEIHKQLVALLFDEFVANFPSDKICYMKFSDERSWLCIRRWAVIIYQYQRKRKK